MNIAKLALALGLGFFVAASVVPAEAQQRRPEPAKTAAPKAAPKATGPKTAALGQGVKPKMKNEAKKVATGTGKAKESKKTFINSKKTSIDKMAKALAKKQDKKSARGAAKAKNSEKAKANGPGGAGKKGKKPARA